MNAVRRKTKRSLTARTRARRNALQALYQWHLTRQDAHAIEAEFRVERMAELNAKVDIEYFSWLVHQVIVGSDRLDRCFTEFLDRPIGQLDPVELAILRIGALELTDRPEVPHGVAINEAIELAKTFGADQSHRYVNGVLDKVARKVRDRTGDRTGAGGR